jgi:circadian clock protein KaiC
MSALSKGEKALFVTFDETKHIFMTRAQGMGWDLPPFIKDKRLHLEQVDPAEFSPGELTGLVCRHVEKIGVGVVVLDSLSGYQNAMPAEQYMLLMMHELLTYLNQKGIVTMLVLAQQGLVGAMQTPVDLTYLSDSVILLRLFEAGGKIRRAISMTKKRTGSHEDTIREYRLDSRGIHVGPPLAKFRGVLTGVPTFMGPENELLHNSDDASWR